MKHLRSTVAALVGMIAVPCTAIAQAVLFEDSFDGGSMSAAWVSKAPSQWVEDGWLHTKDVDGFPRDSLIVAHDGDPLWQDYRVRLSVDFVAGTPWEHANVVLRTDHFKRDSSGSPSGSGYELEFFGNNGWLPGDQDVIQLIRTDNAIGSSIALFRAHWALPSHPFFVDVSLQGGRISLLVDEQPVFDLVDPAPLRSGGLGLHAIWEAEARFDGVYVTAVPEPETAAMLGAGLLCLAWLARRRCG